MDTGVNVQESRFMCKLKLLCKANSNWQLAKPNTRILCVPGVLAVHFIPCHNWFGKGQRLTAKGQRLMFG